MTTRLRQVDRLRPQTGPLRLTANTHHKIRWQHIRRANKVCDKARFGSAIDFLGSTHLHYLTVVEQCDSIRHRQRFILIVGNKDEGNAKLAVQVFQLFLHLLTQFEIERSQGFIEQQHTRLVHQRTRQCNALSLPTRQFAGAAPAKPSQGNQLQCLFSTAVALGFTHAAYHQAIGNIVDYVQVREQGVVLEHRIHVAPKWRHTLGGFAEDFYVTCGRLFETRDESQTGSFARTGGPEHGKKLAFHNLEINLVDGFDRAVVTRNPGELKRSVHTFIHVLSTTENAHPRGWASP